MITLALRSCLSPRIARGQRLEAANGQNSWLPAKGVNRDRRRPRPALTRSAADAAASWRRPGVSDSTGPVQPQIANRRLGEGQPLLGSVAIPGRQPANGGQPVQPEPDRVDRPPALGERAAENGLAAVAAQVAMPLPAQAGHPDVQLQARTADQWQRLVASTRLHLLHAGLAGPAARPCRAAVAG